ncbi:MAG TPA: phage tail sheath subtilisin-like domain-containing protein [Verrucomicrobiae bacterium]|nr:phage tail sheath subtilisin-like domain-containing protein [Verrucomicrobiae bacterium]HTZ56036.1 phage tail sheath subtilisin-like domain-containing protein [Candidatus Acidoferrum sp.]
MTTTYSTPGVYIQELPAIGPIVGVGTSTTAFIGAALQGPSFSPTVVTNWTQFTNTFGSYMINPPGFWMAYAVKGYFDNGGQTAVIVRVGTSATASLTLVDRGGTQDCLVVSALVDGTAGNTITAEVANSQIVPLANNCVATRASSTITSAGGNIIVCDTAAHAAQFSPGDNVVIEGTSDGATVSRVIGTNLVLGGNLSTTYTSGSVRIADLLVGQQTFRVTNGAGLEPGSIIEISDGASSEYQVISAVSGAFITIQSESGLANKYSMELLAAATTIQSFEFTLTDTSPPNVPEVWTNLSMDPRHSHYWGAVVNSLYISLALPSTPDTDTPPNNLPAALATKALAGGTADNPLSLGLSQYTQALTAMVPLTNVELVCVPDRTDQAVQQAVVAHCEQLMDRFAILHTPQGTQPDASMGSPLMLQRAWCTSPNGYAALYYPWILVSNPNSTSSGTMLVPPVGHIAGIYNRTDAIGVQTAPANQQIIDALGLEVNVDGTTQGLLNIAGINVSRIFPGQALPLVWGARTTASNTAWTYINVRRLFIWVETTLKYSLIPYVFNTIDEGLMKTLSRTITGFLTTIWQAGALFGQQASDAFYVEIDDENNPPELMAQGQLNITIGMAPTYPAEFIIVTIGIWQGGTSVTEQT